MPPTPNNSRNFSSLFFDNSGQQKKWFVLFQVFLQIVLTVVFSFWGIRVSVKSYDLSVAQSKDRAQIDTLTAIVKKLNQQNQLLVDQNNMMFTQVNQLRRITMLSDSSNEIQTQHFATVKQNINDSKVPKLSIEKAEYELGPGGQAEFADMYYLKMVNYGGDMLRLRSKELDTIGNAHISLPVTSLPRDADIDLTFVNPFLYTHKTRLRMRFTFEDALQAKYYQDLTIIENDGGENVLFQMGKMTSLAK